MKRIESLLASLNAASIRYVVIGATAFAVHGWVRATADLDLFVDDDPANLERLRRALQEFGYDVEDASVEDFGRFKILLRQYDLPLDLHPFVAGVSSFEEVWSRRIQTDLGTVQAPFASLEDLISMKRAAGRQKGAEDLRQLELIQRTRRQGD
jgi:predicted nucleotidyltransferase